jgi:hypothetical protein
VHGWLDGEGLSIGSGVSGCGEWERLVGISENVFKPIWGLHIARNFLMVRPELCLGRVRFFGNP